MATVDGQRPRRPEVPWLAVLVGRPRRLSSAEVRAIKARPWPRLPLWLWLAAALTTVAMVAVALTLVLRPSPDAVSVPLGARRSPPGAGLAHDVGAWRAPALEPPSAARAEVATVTCPRLAGLRVAGTSSDVRLLLAAADDVCALRSLGGIDQARAALAGRAVVVAFAGFSATGNESTVLVDPGRAGKPLDLRGGDKAVLVNGKFAGGAPERVAALLIHEGAHLAARGGTGPAEQELAARKAELAACGRLFRAGGPRPGLRPNRGCQDAADLLALGDARALAALRAAGYP